MTSLGDLLRGRSDLDEAEVAHLHRLVGEWHIVADLSFADLLMFVRDSRAPRHWLCVAQIRPSTGSTLYVEDLVAAQLPVGEREALDTAWDRARIVREGEPIWRDDAAVREEGIPVRAAPGGRVIAVLARDIDVGALRTPSSLELAYLAAAGDLATMVSEAAFPFPRSADTAAEAPRVGDGMVRLDSAGTIAYASPNAQSALRRLGFSGRADGQQLLTLLAAVGPQTEVMGPRPPSTLDAVLQAGLPAEAELSARDGDGTVRLRLLPLLPGGELAGTVVLLRDVTEVRRRDRALVTKDATIREIHHRVKNNLTTVAALLRLQARRTTGDARFALEESVRRVTSISVVHETLSQALEERVAFDAIADTIVSMSIDLATTEGGRAVSQRIGAFGMLSAEIATPLALVLSELVSNAVEHAYAGGGGAIEVRVERRPGRLEVIVADRGPGLPPGFDLDAGGLGLQIVRTLVQTELRGSFALAGGAEGGTEARVELPTP